MSTDPTPIPAEALEAAAKVAFRHYESEYTAAPNMTWRDFVPEVRELVEAAAPALLAAGRTAAAAQVRAIAADIRTSEGQPGEWVPSTTGMLAVLIDGVAARVAENGADR